MRAEFRRIGDGRKGILRETDRAVTPFGGLAVWVELLGRLEVLPAVRARLPFTYRSNNASAPEHILLALLRHYPKTADKLLRCASRTSEDLLGQLKAQYPDAPSAKAAAADLQLSWESRSVVDKARKCAARYGQSWIGLEHLLVGLVSYHQAAGRWFRARVIPKVFLQENGLYREPLESAISSLQAPFEGQARGEKSETQRTQR